MSLSVGLLCRSMEDKNVESSTGNSDLACDVSEGSRDPAGLLCEESVVSNHLALKSWLCLARDQNHESKAFALLGE